jgi:hypothetical protein
MTDRPPDHPPSQGSDGPTRDIRRPPLPPPPYSAPDDEPTDRLRPPDEQDRRSTLAFDSPPPGVGYGRPPFGSPGTSAPVVPPSAPAPPPRAARPGPAERKWPWVLLVLLPLVVIVVTGLVLALLLGA